MISPRRVGGLVRSFNNEQYSFSGCYCCDSYWGFGIFGVVILVIYWCLAVRKQNSSERASISEQEGLGMGSRRGAKLWKIQIQTHKQSQGEQVKLLRSRNLQ